MIEAIVNSPVKVAVGVVLVVMFGVIALATMPIQLIPEVEIPTLTVETKWPGASPEEVEREIVQEQEEQLQSVEGLRKMSSESADSSGKITLEFPVGTDLSDAMLRVNTRLGQVPEYPEDADEPVIATSNSNNQFIAWFILSPRVPASEEIDAFIAKHPALAAPLETVRKAHNPGLAMYRLRKVIEKNPEAKELLPSEVDVTKLRRFAEDTIETRFERVEGVSASNVIGGREDELQVIVDPQKLAARQLTIIDIRNALRALRDVSAGDFWEGKRRYVVRTMGERRTVDDVANAVIVRRDDGPVYVRDVATVRLGHKKPNGMVRRYGTEVLAINVQRETGSNVLTIMDGLRATAKQLNEGILKQRGLQLAQVHDETEYIYSSIHLVNENLYEGGLLTLLALLLFLRSFRSSVVIFVSICVSFIGMFLVMRLLNRSLNVPSLAGIAFASGMLVDNFIVVLENIFRHRNEGEGGLEAVVNGTREVWGAVLAATLANLAVFVPVLFVRDEAGQLFRDIALAVSAALGMSLLVALILVPTAASSILRSGASAQWAQVAASDRSLWARFCRTIFWPLDRFGRWFVDMVVGVNAWLQKGLLRQVVTAVSMIATSLFLSWIMLPQVEYLPNGNRNLMLGFLLPPPGYNLDQLANAGSQIETLLEPYWNIDPDSPEAAKLDAPMIGDFFYVALGKFNILGLKSYDPLRAAELQKLVFQLGPVMPGYFVFGKQASLFESGLSGGRNIDVEITGPDVRKLVGLGGQILGQVMGPQSIIPGAQARPVPSLDLSSPEMHILPKWDQAADMGVSAADLGYTVDALVDGAYATDFYLGGDKVDLSILGTDKFTGRTQDLQALAIATPKGQLIPLAAVANVEYSSGPEQINRRERQRTITIQVTPPPEVALGSAIELIQSQIVAPLEKSGQLGNDYQINLSGTADKLRTTWQSLKWNLLLAVIITYLLIAALFESWVYPLIIMLSVPLGGVGGFAGLWLLNRFVLQPLDVLTMLGFIILIGTVVNNPILIVEQALSLIREEGMPPRQAILESVRTRIRPIFMTAFIGLFGLLPLVISPGAGSELYRGLGSVLLGGLVASTVFTLIFVPTVFDLSMHMSQWFNRRLRGNHGTIVAAEDASEPEESIMVYDG